MRVAPSKLPLFVFEALGSLACGFYGNYVFFLFRDQHGFGNLGNLGVASLMGLVIALASWQSGKFAERRGCIGTIHAGLFGMVVALSVGAFMPALPVQLAVLVVWAASQFMVWPALEAMVTSGVGGAARARLVGIYSVVWASCSALSHFFGGAVFEWLGSTSIFWLPPGLHVVSMDVGGARAEQGGIHEAMMGAGNFIGPGIGALSLMIAPHAPHAGVWAVGGVLVVGLAVLLGNRLNASA